MTKTDTRTITNTLIVTAPAAPTAVEGGVPAMAEAALIPERTTDPLEAEAGELDEADTDSTRAAKAEEALEQSVILGDMTSLDGMVADNIDHEDADLDDKDQEEGELDSDDELDQDEDDENDEEDEEDDK